jgi:hypothetical protein
MSPPATSGVSPKTLAAGFAPTVGGLTVALVNFAITGHFDSTSIAALIAGSGGGLVSTIAAYLAKPGPLREAIVDASAAAHADPRLVARIEAAVKAEVAKLPASVEPIERAVEGDLVDPILRSFPETVPDSPVGDAGVVHVPAADPRDAQIQALRAQLAAAQASAAPPVGPVTALPGQGA